MNKGYFYHQGVGGVLESFEEAVKWLQQASSGGSKEAMHYLALLRLDQNGPIYDAKVDPPSP